MIQTGEGEEFAAISRQEQRGQGWALRSALRDLWVGAAIGSHGSVRERQHKLHAHTYAAGCLVAVQHENASAVLGRAEVGDRQRWIVLPAKPTGIDPASIPDIHNHPAIRIHPDWGENQRWAWLGVEEGVAAERDAWIRAGYEIHQPSQEELEDWASFNHGEHTMLLRLKLASNLLILLGRPPVIDYQTWLLAGDLMRISVAEKTSIDDYETRRVEEQVQQRGRTDAIRQQSRHQRLEEEYQQVLEETAAEIKDRIGTAAWGKSEFHQRAARLKRRGRAVQMDSKEVVKNLIGFCETQGIIRKEEGKWTRT